MENASKFLIIAGGILIGLMTISLIMFLYRGSGELTNSLINKVEKEDLAKYNEPFTKLSSMSSDSESNQKSHISIYDIISVTNYAKNINENLDNIDDFDHNNRDKFSNYIWIEIEGLRLNIDGKNVELSDLANMGQDIYHALIGECADNDFIVTTIEFNSNTGKVNYVVFKQK